ncbi:MAG: SEL1-like repeat protein [Epsilonproteobacteria bacterium]|nr:SEL1-like repeat protein [Campylobacterota bacterium]
MKKLILFISVTWLFAIDFTFTKGYMAYHKAIKLQQYDKQKANKEFNKARELLTKVIKKYPSAQSYYMLAKIYANGWGVKKDFLKAEEYYLQAIKLGNKRAYCGIAKLYIQEKKYKEAKKYLKHALSHSEISGYCNGVDISILKDKK